VPVIRQPFAPDDPVPYWAMGGFTGDHLYDLDDDPSEQHDLAAETGLATAAADAAELLRTALTEVDAPDDQLARLGLR
jgi:hypothetical protein